MKIRVSESPVDYRMLGAIVGDIVGSVYEFDNHRSKDFPLFRQDSKFTDDSAQNLDS